MGEIKGCLMSGMEKAQHFLSMEEYQDRIETAVGFRPFPGTLNLEVDPERARQLKQSLEEKRVDSFDKDGKSFGGLSAYPVEFNGRKAAVLEIDRSDYGDEILELIAKEELRENLGLKDGDEVVLNW